MKNINLKRILLILSPCIIVIIGVVILFIQNRLKAYPASDVDFAFIVALPVLVVLFASDAFIKALVKKHPVYVWLIEILLIALIIYIASN